MTAARTLLDAFTPPDGLVGHSAALVAMTAHKDLLDEIMTRFTGLRGPQRAQLGVNLAFLMLDPHASPARSQVLRPGQVPGLYELQPRAVPPSSLLHAKLGLLAFSETRTGDPVSLRLVVLTGNYTLATVKQHLELVWVAEVAREGGSPAQDRVDVAEAAAFVEALVEARFHRVDGNPGTVAVTQRLETLVRAARELRPARGRPRFVHSLIEPLYAQVVAGFKRELPSPRNLLICGSGFFEKTSKKGSKPDILAKLETLPGLTAQPRRVLVAERYGSGAVASWVNAGDTGSWTVVEAVDRAELGRRLHAKFVYAGHLRDRHLSNGCLYLGSGNLSKRGLLTSGQMREGNVECGVVVSVPERLSPEEGIERFFWDQGATPADLEDWAEGLDDEPESEVLVAVPPILAACVERATDVTERGALSVRLTWRTDLDPNTQVSVRLGDHAWQRLAIGAATIAVTSPAVPPVLLVREEGRGEEWAVPIVDGAGRVAWQAITADTFEDALANVLAFPLAPAEASGDDEDEQLTDDAERGLVVGEAGEEPADARSYALHAAAELIERVAALQQSLDAWQLDDWLDHLERVLVGFPRDIVHAWRDYRLEVLAHLHAAALRPSELSESQTQRYVGVLERTADQWRTS